MLGLMNRDYLCSSSSVLLVLTIHFILWNLSLVAGFLPFLGSFLELCFTCILFTFWFIIAQKLRSKDGTISFTLFLKLTLGLVAVYAISSTVLYGLASTRDSMSPLFGVPDSISAIGVMFYVSSALYICVVLTFFATLVITVQPINNRKEIQARFLFFGVPTLGVIISVLVGIFMGTIGPFGRDSPSFVYYLVLYNLYVYVMLWGYWPVDQSFDGANPSEKSTLVFAKATEPKLESI